MIKKSVLLHVFFVFSISAGLFAQEKLPVIFEDNFKNLGKGNDAVGETLKRSLKMILEITRKYEVVYSGNIANYLAKNNIRDIKPAEVTEKYIESNFIRLGFDEVLYGTFRPYDNGDQVEIRIIVLTLAENKVKFDKTYRSATDADIFDAIDKIGLDLASVLVGRRLGFGTLSVINTFDGADIFVDGIKSGKDKVLQNTAIAGLRHKVEIINKKGKVLFNRDFEIQDRGVYDLTFSYDEIVEVIDENKVTNRMKKEEYNRRGSVGGFKTGPMITVGGGGFLWGGWYFDWENVSLTLNLTCIPRIPNYMYDWYIGGSAFLAFYAFDLNSASFNFYLKTGVLEYYGIELGFVPYSPYAYIGVGIQIQPNWSWVPQFMRGWKIFIEGGTEQDLGIFWKNFSSPDSGGSSSSSFKNVGWPMLSVGIRF